MQPQASEGTKEDNDEIRKAEQFFQNTLSVLALQFAHHHTDKTTGALLNVCPITVVLLFVRVFCGSVILSS